MLKPLLQSLRGLNDKERLLKIENLESAIEKNVEQRQVLTNLMVRGYLEPALFNKENNELVAEHESLMQEKESLVHAVNGDITKADELKKLIGFTSKKQMMTEYDDAVFLEFVNRIIVYTRTEIAFDLKCGLVLKERLVEI